MVGYVCVYNVLQKVSDVYDVYYVSDRRMKTANDNWCSTERLYYISGEALGVVKGRWWFGFSGRGRKC